MIIALLIIHGLLAVALLGAITHQAIGVWLPARPGAQSFVARLRSVSTPAYVTAVIVLFIATSLLGGIIYPNYPLNVRIVLEQTELHKSNGSFELKEHWIAVGMGVLPVYWYLWRQPLAEQLAASRKIVTTILASSSGEASWSAMY